MANLIGIAGGSHKERKIFLSQAFLNLETSVHFKVHYETFGDMSVAWTATPATPVSFQREGLRAAFVMGSLGLGRDREPKNADVILRAQDRNGSQSVSGMSGYYLAISLEANGTILLGTDILGLFPLYYHTSPEGVFIFSTTPSVFRHYSEFKETLSMEGLVGILLTNVMVGGQTLLKGVKRLSCGHALMHEPGQAAKEIGGEMIVPSDRYFGNTFKQNVQIIDDILKAVVHKSTGGDVMTLLSGGLDSRLLAGYLSEAHGRRVRAVTQGRKDDFETQCARRVARRLGWKHTVYPTDELSSENFARFNIEQEQLGCGFNTPYFMQLAFQFRGTEMPVYTGVHGDSALGGAVIERVFDSKAGRCTFEAHLAHLNKADFSVNDIRCLIPKHRLKDAVENVITKLRETYNACPGEHFQRAWLFDLTAADRHQVGFIPRALTLGTWPLMPFTDKSLLTAVANMPYETIANRRLQRELVCTRFPKLAVLPLDRNSFDTSPVYGLKKLAQRNSLSCRHAAEVLWGHACSKSRSWIDQITHEKTGTEKRFYYRTFDLNGKGWKQIRQTAEGSRGLLEEIFEPDALNRLWPRSYEQIQLLDGINDSRGIKVLLGLSMWRGQRTENRVIRRQLPDKQRSAHPDFENLCFNL